MEVKVIDRILEWMDFNNRIMCITWVVCCILFVLHLILYIINSFTRKVCDTQEIVPVQEDKEFNCRLAEAIVENRVIEVYGMLNSHPELINRPTECNGYTPFMLACARNRTQLVKYMLSRGADVHKKSPNNESAFYLAVFYFIDNKSDTNSSCIRELYYAGADVNEPNSNGYTPLQMAAMFGHTPLVKWLLIKDAKITVTPHPHAIAISQENIQKIVEEHGKEVIQNIMEIEQNRSAKSERSHSSSSSSNGNQNDEHSITLVYEDTSMIGTQVNMTPVNTTIVRDQETQTEAEMDKDYLAIKKKYDDIKAEYQKLCSLLKEVRSNMNDSLTVFESFDGNTKKTNKLQNDDQSDEDDQSDKENNKRMVTIGSNGTKVEKNIYNGIKWGNHSSATKTLLTACFTREVLATHSLTGKRSPALINTNKKTKQRLDPLIVDDIIECILKKCNVPEPMVRQAITSKCTDENKLLKRRESNI